jgi:hypothetical protein
MMAQASHRTHFQGYQGSGALEISAYRASNAADFFDHHRKTRFSPHARGTLIRPRPSWARTPDAFGVSLHFGFAAERGRYDRKKVQDEDGFVITTRPPKRGRSIPWSLGL